jgi:hypothetical protein
MAEKTDSELELSMRGLPILNEGGAIQEPFMEQISRLP